MLDHWWTFCVDQVVLRSGAGRCGETPLCGHVSVSAKTRCPPPTPHSKKLKLCKLSVTETDFDTKIHCQPNPEEKRGGVDHSISLVLGSPTLYPPLKADPPATASYPAPYSNISI